MGAQKMVKMEQLQKKKKKKILESEQIEFDAYCRASRQYLIGCTYLAKIEAGKKENLKQQVQLYKQQNKENKEKFIKSVKVRNRLREIKQKHVEAFLQIIQREGQDKKKQNQAKEQQQQQRMQQSKPKTKAKPKPKPKPETPKPSP